MNRELVKQLDQMIDARRTSRYRIEQISKVNQQIANRINSFMSRKLTSSTFFLIALLFVLAYVEGAIFPYPGIIIEISLAIVISPIIAVIVSVISLVDKDNWRKKKPIFNLIPTFARKKRKFIETDPEIKNALSELKRLKDPYYRVGLAGNYKQLNLSANYNNERALSKIRAHIVNGRADNLKEAINIYEQEEESGRRDEALQSQQQEIDELNRKLDSMDREESRRVGELKQQRAGAEHNIRKSIDDFRRYK